MQGDLVHALSELRILVGHEWCGDAAVLSRPGGARVVGAVDATGGDRDVHALLVDGVEEDRMQSKSAVARHPARAVGMIEQSANQIPGFAAVASFEQGCGLDSAVEMAGFVRRAEGDLPDVF